MINLKVELKWALIFALVSLLWMMLEKASGLHDNYIDYHMYLTNLFLIPAIYLFRRALKDKKISVYNGVMSYKQGLMSGVVMSVIIALISPATQWITTYIITPEYFPNVIKRSVELGYYKTTEEAAAYFNYANYAKQGAFGMLFMGIIISAIAMIFLRTKSAE